MVSLNQPKSNRFAGNSDTPQAETSRRVSSQLCCSSREPVGFFIFPDKVTNEKTPPFWVTFVGDLIGTRTYFASGAKPYK